METDTKRKLVQQLSREVAASKKFNEVDLFEEARIDGIIARFALRANGQWTNYAHIVLTSEMILTRSIAETARQAVRYAEEHCVDLGEGELAPTICPTCLQILGSGKRVDD